MSIDATLLQKARHYASLHDLRLAEPLGSGVHGIVLIAEGNVKSGKTAVKAHRSREPYSRERDVYLRLQQAGIRAGSARKLARPGGMS